MYVGPIGCTNKESLLLLYLNTYDIDTIKAIIVKFIPPRNELIAFSLCVAVNRKPCKSQTPTSDFLGNRKTPYYICDCDFLGNHIFPVWQ